MHKATQLIPIAACTLATTAAAQQLEGGWLIRTSNVVSPSIPSTTVEIWAGWNDPTGQACCFMFGDFDLAAQEGEFNSPTVLILPNAPWSEPGQVSGNGDAVRGAFVGLGVLTGGPSDNPILVWSATWTTTSFAPRSVGMWTENTATFMLGIHSVNFLIPLELFPDNFVPGTGSIAIVPTPATAVPIALLGTLALGRRRTS